MSADQQQLGAFDNQDVNPSTEDIHDRLVSMCPLGSQQPDFWCVGSIRSLGQRHLGGILVIGEDLVRCRRKSRFYFWYKIRGEHRRMAVANIEIWFMLRNEIGYRT